MSFIKKLSIVLIFIFGLFLISCDTKAEDEAKILEVKNLLVVPTEKSENYSTK